MGTSTDRRSIDEVVAGIRANAADGRLTLSASGHLVEGVHAEVDARHHHLDLDEPAALGGTDAGPNPVETILAALGACQAITYRVWATMLGVRLDDVRFHTEGEIDLAGFLGLRDDVRPGLTGVSHRVTLVGPESDERYRELVATVDRHCPVLDIVAHGVPVHVHVDVSPA
jgi:uncharacterized OsmC-like protein